MAKAIKGEPVVQVQGVRELLRAINRINKNLQDDIRDASTDIANDLVRMAQGEASTPLERAVAGGVVVRRDRVPTVRVGAKVVTHTGAKAAELFYGAEFGGRRRATTQQFQPHLGTQGYWFYPAARAGATRHYNMWVEAIDRAMRPWNYRPPG